MKVFKFGGASVCDACGVRNVGKVLCSQGFESCLLVVSAMGKTTNALEAVVEAYFAKSDYLSLLEEIKDRHQEISTNLFVSGDSVFNRIENLWKELSHFLDQNTILNYDFVYDQVVSYGELVSSIILSAHLQNNGFPNIWLDARDYIKTDSAYREGNIDWDETIGQIRTLDPTSSYVTQGFIASDMKGATITLGREGSDYSAAVFAYGLDASAMTIWKDVPGVMTGDPRVFPQVELLEDISYEEAIEMAYFGASVIHPKTLQPLKQKEIPFFVKSFLSPEMPGTKIGKKSPRNQHKESFVLKKNQCLIRISTRDFSFVAEDHMRDIFDSVSRHRLRVSLVQNSAISLSLCVEDRLGNLDAVCEELRPHFITECSTDLSLFTVRHVDMSKLSRYYDGKEILLEQMTKGTLQLVIR